ncbi:MAG: gliding motility-associated C-terminal domain-containing protein [Bacteroidales bacterium]|nr:gliding motility-associated C-terminal domain-containing protein [Bacteroidales bacterium]
MKISNLFVVLLAWMCFTSAWGWTYESAFAEQVATDSIVAPNVFTPNGDGENEFFEVTSSAGNVVVLKVFTRAGVLIFSITAKTCKWDGCSQNGDEMAQSVYFYIAEVPGSSPKVSKSGFVHLFR